MDFKKDKTYAFPEMMAYGFSKDGDNLLADCHLYLGDNSFEGALIITIDAFHQIIKNSDDKSGAFEKTCDEWLLSDKTELFLPDSFPEPVHCKLKDMQFRYEKFEEDEDEFGSERVFHFSLEPQTA